MNSNHILGVDVGGVIIDAAKNDDTDTSFFSHNYLATTAVPGAFDALRILAARFEGRAFIVSKCGAAVEAKTRAWLAHHHFYEHTGIFEANLRFCLRRHEKAPICKELGVTHFIDDTLEVLTYLTGIVPNRYLFNPNREDMRKFHLLSSSPITRVCGWNEVLAYLAPRP